MTLKEMGAIMEIPFWDVHKIKTKLKEGIYLPGEAMPPSRSVQETAYLEEQPKKIVRPPAVYLNRSHEQTIDYWMNYPI
ncbi:hypothetical protein ACX0G7_09775 [Flavitalea antarctica]